ncbi:MAG: TIGR00730 family Rossman fold protein [bacterium]|nr:TIGR00730 family Rossman fold protein [bacterium]
MTKTICVYSSSSDAVAAPYFEAADQLGTLLGKNGYTLVYGGASIGLMGRLARAVHQQGGKVVGVIPKSLNNLEITYQEADELIVTRDLRERKAVMEERSDAFISLPGGFGTLEETLEILTLKQIQQHSKPVVLLNIANFFQDLVRLFERIFRESFAKSEQRQLYCVAPGAEQAMAYIDSYIPPKLQKKWF